MKLINGVGIVNPNIAIVGEAPGVEEELQGQPFMGRSGKLVNQVLEDLGIPREKCYITNVVKIRPAGNRTPTNDEIRHWQHYLTTELEYVQPRVIVTLGVVPWKAMCGYFSTSCDWKITKERGQLKESHIPAKRGLGYVLYVPTIHPAYCLRYHKEIDNMKADFKMALQYSTKQAMDELVGESERLGLYK